jgi:hypothetical protein
LVGFVDEMLNKLNLISGFVETKFLEKTSFIKEINIISLLILVKSFATSQITIPLIP